MNISREPFQAGGFSHKAAAYDYSIIGKMCFMLSYVIVLSLLNAAGCPREKTPCLVMHSFFAMNGCENG